MKQRLGIAQALLHDPDLIILDEPTTGLDPMGMKEIRDLIIHLSRDQKKTVFLSSHILNEVEQVANRMIIINKGTAKVEGNVKDLLDATNLSVTVEVSDVLKAGSLISESGWSEKLKGISGNRMEFNIGNQETAQLNKFFIENGVDVYSIVPTRSLEEYFLRITQEAI
ncbi:MAG: ABC transporter ATP-binding protein, partial [Ignavibacterium sp.]